MKNKKTKYKMLLAKIDAEQLYLNKIANIEVELFKKIFSK